MNFKNFDWDKLERNIGGLKFAVVIVLIFSTYMVIGTFIESYYGTDFAGRAVYKTWGFMLTQFLMVLSIIFAALLRLPPKKRLYGFYTVHAGMVIIGMGSVITYIAGIDGNITLAPNNPTRQVVLNRDVIKIVYPEEGKQVTHFLPSSAFKTTLNDTYEQLEFVDYLPFAEPEFMWKEANGDYDVSNFFHSSTYHFKNAFAEQEFTLSLHPEATDFNSSFSMGPLNVSYMPFAMANCFLKNNPSKLILWNGVTNECQTPEEANIPIKTTKEGNRFLVIQENGEIITFFPDLSPYPMDANLVQKKNSQSRFFSKKLFEGKPHLFLFGKAISYYDKDASKWVTQSIEEKGETIVLPWMNAEIKLVRHENTLIPSNYPVPVIPIQKNGALIKGATRAVSLSAGGKTYWVTNNNPLGLEIGNKKVNIYLTKETLTLPFEIVLTKFKMDKDPGTNNPASYESFVKLFTGNGSTDHHVFMNNPLKYEGFTFYQASYGQDDNGNYFSTLSVNVDQGRFLKYLGSLMLVLGATWHFYINRKRYSKDTQSNNKEITA